MSIITELAETLNIDPTEEDYLDLDFSHYTLEDIEDTLNTLGYELKFIRSEELRYN